MSQRQSERGSRFKVEIEHGICVAAAMLRDNDPELSVRAALRLWWTSRLRGRQFAQLVRQARELTQERISLGVVQRGEAGRREAMPYFFAVLRHLADQHRQRHAHDSRP